jgi:hypothetical protein
LPVLLLLLLLLELLEELLLLGADVVCGFAASDLFDGGIFVSETFLYVLGMQGLLRVRMAECCFSLICAAVNLVHAIELQSAEMMTERMIGWWRRKPRRRCWLAVTAVGIFLEDRLHFLDDGCCKLQESSKQATSEQSN